MAASNTKPTLSSSKGNLISREKAEASRSRPSAILSATCFSTSSVPFPLGLPSLSTLLRGALVAARLQWSGHLCPSYT